MAGIVVEPEQEAKLGLRSPYPPRFDRLPDPR